jgi:hypothetical protein
MSPIRRRRDFLSTPRLSFQLFESPAIAVDEQSKKDECRRKKI